MSSIYENVTFQLNLPEEEYSKPETLDFPSIPPIKSLGFPVKSLLFPSLRDNYLAHGSYGACPSLILNYYQSLQSSIEQNPSNFYHNLLFPLLIYSIRRLSAHLNLHPSRLVLVKNVEVGITTVLKLYKNAICLDINYRAIQYSISKHSSLSICTLTRPITSDSIVRDFELFMEGVGVSEGDGVVVLEHITSPTAIVLPLSRLVPLAHAKGYKVLIDGAHSVGQVEAKGDWDYYTSNLHKWMCSPRGVGYLYVKEGVKEPEGLVCSWGEAYGMQGRFVWQGTDDYSGYLTIPFILYFFEYLDSLHPLGYKQRNIDLCRYGRDFLTSSWGTTSLVENIECAMCAILVPNIPGLDRQPTSEEMSKLRLVPNFVFDGKRYVRISCHVYNTEDDLRILDKEMKALLDEIA